MGEVNVMAPDDINSLFDLLKYGWVVGLAWVNKLMGRIKQLEDKALLSASKADVMQEVEKATVSVEERLDKSLSRVDRKLDRIEKLLWDRYAPTAKPPSFGDIQ